MRRVFADFLLNEMEQNEKIIIITADIGYGVLDKIRTKFPERFYNIGSSETLMIGMAVGFCYEGFIPICYTITPFLLYRPFEMIRNYVNYEKLNLKLVGSGRDKDYSHDGFTHWAEDDTHIVSNCFQNIEIYKPEILTKEIFMDFINNKPPCYLNLKRSI
jgi:transketolase